jgi:hypothetical protein
MATCSIAVTSIGFGYADPSADRACSASQACGLARGAAADLSTNPTNGATNDVAPKRSRSYLTASPIPGLHWI